MIPPALAAALAELADDPALRSRVGRSGPRMGARARLVVVVGEPPRVLEAL